MVKEEDYDPDQIEETKERAELVANNSLLDDSDDEDSRELPSVLEAFYKDAVCDRKQSHQNALFSMGQKPSSSAEKATGC